MGSATVAQRLQLPHSMVYSPWTLVNHEGQLRLAYMIKLFGTGFPVGQPNGGRGILMDDTGSVKESDEIAFREAQLLHEWRNRPTAVQLERRENANVPLFEKVRAYRVFLRQYWAVDPFTGKPAILRYENATFPKYEVAPPRTCRVIRFLKAVRLYRFVVRRSKSEPRV